MNLLDFTIGADPELFIFDKSKKKVISSIGIIPGFKGDAYTEGMPKGFGIQIDNILGEFNIPPTNLTLGKEFVNNIMYMKTWIKNYVKNINPDYTVRCSASELIDEDQLQSDEAKEFGCSPDYNIYTQSENPKPKGTNTNLRTTGCHIHIGYPRPTVEASLHMIYYMDLYLGIPSIVLDTDIRRRELYGKAGCFRLTPYGFEYRVLSGFFISTPKIIEFVHTQTMKAIKAYLKHEALPNSSELIKIINSGNVAAAQQMITKYNLV